MVTTTVNVATIPNDVIGKPQSWQIRYGLLFGPLQR